MSNPLDTDAGTELFSNYISELQLLQADLSQKLDSIPQLTGEERKSALRAASRALDEAKELLDQLALEKTNIPSSVRSKANQSYRNAQSDVDVLSRKLKSLANDQNDRKALFGDRYTDEPGDAQLEQRQQLLSGTERLGRSSQRLQESQRIALETEGIGAGTLADLHQQRAVIENTHRNLQQSEGYVDRSVKTLRGMARR
jgi:vesicle transport through interaction with t-SNAREs 1